MHELATASGLGRDLFCLVAIIAVGGSLVFTFDDLWIDLCAGMFRLRPRELHAQDLSRLNELPQKRIAIMIANWQEDDILERMITGNLNRIDYQNFTFFLGVYPNDHKTWELAQSLQSLHANVMVVVNSRPGPTTKGQMLNEIVRTILKSEAATGLSYDLFLMQDSEDVLHPLALKVINEASLDSDFVQTPVFSFDVPLTSWTRGTYLEEFAESHTKDLLVRQHLGAAIPSAGVGTALSRELVKAYTSRSGGMLLREDTLTEDYDLGLRTKELGLKSSFVCCFQKSADGSSDFVATREFFPGTLKSSIRQKTRWTLGIAFQGRDNLGWHGEWIDRYFFFRDRRGPLNSIMMIFGLMTVAGFSLNAVGTVQLPNFLRGSWFTILAGINGVNMCMRVIQRARCVARVNDRRHIFAVPIRWPLGMYINAMASYHAYVNHRKAKRTGDAPKWEKTAHELPLAFGTLPVLTTSKIQVDLSAIRKIQPLTLPKSMEQSTS